MTKLFKIRKPRLTVGKRGVHISSPSLRIGGRTGMNFSRSGVSSSVRTPIGTYNSRRGCGCPLFLLGLIGFAGMIGWVAWQIV